MSSIVSFIKGKLKQREVRKLVPDENFEFDKVSYGDADILDGFNFIYCNNYTDKFTKDCKDILSFISCVISVPTETKTFIDLGEFMNKFFEIDNNFNTLVSQYNNIFMKIGLDRIQLFLRGNILFYTKLCENIHNNIFTRYIRNNIFPDETVIETPNEYLDKMLNSINNPYKELDILFIEDKVLCEGFNNVIGLSMNEKAYNKFIKKNDNFTVIMGNNRYIIYTQVKALNDEQIEYLISNVAHGDKLFSLLHDSNDYSDIDEIIEE